MNLFAFNLHKLFDKWSNKIKNVGQLSYTLIQGKIISNKPRGQ